jgi:hypothetical protein
MMSLADHQARHERIAATRALSVKSTRLFARRQRDEQYLVYQMAIDAPVEVAMILPLPVSVVADDAIEFLDLSALPQFFDRLHTCFDEPVSRGGFRGAPQALSAPKLVVHNVGSFEASWVPTLADMDRLDERFRLADKVWRDLPQFADYGFAVFKLKAGAHTIHPMAMRFPTKDPALYFPTVHVHDGEVHREAAFDHELYFQCDNLVGVDAPRGATPAIESGDRPEHHLDVDKTRGAVVRNTMLHRVQLRGTFANTDTRVRI